jgi:uncharacterized protein YndB with AHSA1/START domain
MTAHDFTYNLLLDAPPARVFEAIVDVHSWWSGRIDGAADRLGAEFRYRYAELHDSTQRVVALVPGQRVAWRVLDANLRFVDDAHEWKGTEIVFALSQRGPQTELVFTHVGLTPACACYGACAGGWMQLLGGKLRRRVATGRAQPDVFA